MADECQSENMKPSERHACNDQVKAAAIGGVADVNEKQTTANKPICIIVLGMAGSGKTTVVQLEEKLFTTMGSCIYSCMHYGSAGQMPFFLMFGREPRLPVDLVFGLDKDSGLGNLSDYIQSLQNRLEESCKLATWLVGKPQEKQKRAYDLKARAATLQPGDRVLVKIVAFDGEHKIADHWETNIYIVQHQTWIFQYMFVHQKCSKAP